MKRNSIKKIATKNSAYEIYPIKRNIGTYLIHSFLYYILNESVISDNEYDSLCYDLLKHWGDHKDHMHAHLVSKEDLSAGTGFSIKYEDYPLIVKSCAEGFLAERGIPVDKELIYSYDKRKVAQVEIQSKQIGFFTF